MKKATDEVRENLKLVDLVIEVVDARIPVTSSNPMLGQLIQGKKKIEVLTKADLSDEESVKAYLSRKKNEESDLYRGSVILNGLTGEGLRELKQRIAVVSGEIAERLKARGRRPRDIRVMVVGVPNVGKSSVINKIAGRNVCKAGNKPGVTRGKQWISIGRGITLLDTPGILWPKLEGENTGFKLAVTGAIRDEILSTEELSLGLLALSEIRGTARECYSLAQSDSDGAWHKETDGHLLLIDIARARGFLQSGGEPDTARAARLVLDDYRRGSLGKLNLDDLMPR